MDEMKNKNLVILISSLFKGGAERAAVNIAGGLGEKGYKIFLITLENGCDFEIPGFIQHRVISNLHPRAHKFIKMLYTPFQVSRLCRILIKIKPGAVFSLMERPNFLNVLLRNPFNFKSIVSVRCFPSETPQGCKKGWDGFLRRAILGYTVRRADKIISVSDDIERDLVKNFKAPSSRTFTIYNPYDIEKIRNLSGAAVGHPWFSENTPILINSGRLVRAKAQWHLIRAFAKVRKKYEARLVILGEGALEAYLKKLVRELNLSDDVAFLGWQKNPFKYISKSDIFIFPSLYEGFPNSLVEAMICRTAVISSNCRSGPEEILQRGRCGVLTPVPDGKYYNADAPLTSEEEILAFEMINLLQDEQSRDAFRNKAFKRIKEFSKDVIISRYEKELFE